jgi:hypothetical protein
MGSSLLELHFGTFRPVALDILGKNPREGSQMYGSVKYIKVTGEECYEYLVVYTDDIVVIGEKPIEVLPRLKRYFP